jgi:hypothetical protein
MDRGKRMIGTIQQANKSKSGKTLSVQVDGTWYSSKEWELEQAVGRRVIFEPSTQNFPDGGSIQWLNDYVFEDASTTPAGMAMDERMAQGHAAGAAQGVMPQGQTTAAIAQAQAHRTLPNKDSLIGALALTKSISGQPEQVWEAFVYFYHKMESFDPSLPF